MVQYHLLHTSASSALEVENEADLLIAGDGVYSAVRCFGISIPFPLVLCEIRGLLPLSELLFLGMLAPGEILPGEENETESAPLSFAPSYHVLAQSALPTLDASRIYQYVIAREGVFLLAGCPGIEVLLPISPLSDLPGLASATPYIHWKHPRVDEATVRDLFGRARAARDEYGHLQERLFYLLWKDGWQIREPEQIVTATSVQVTASSEEDETALLEGHSHHSMRAYFSSTDNRDEVTNGGFKIYFVLGQVNTSPQIRTRICIHGYSWEVPAEHFFELPADVQDCVGVSPLGGWL